MFSPEDLKNRFPILECDINFADLHHELQLLPATFRETCPLIKKVTWIQTGIDFMILANMKIVFMQFHRHLRHYLTISMSNATSERAFSTLQKVKSFLRTRLTQTHINHFIVLHAHKHLTDEIEIKLIAKIFVNGDSKRKLYFGLM